MTRPEDPKSGYVTIAAACFAVSGYHGTSLAAVARAAGVTKQALLHFFGSKEKLYAAVLGDLAQRLQAEVAAAADPDTMHHLRSYFAQFHAQATSGGSDIRLVVRALLDSDAAARNWPLKPYLETLLALIAQTPGGAAMPQAMRSAWLSQQIGTVQYMAIAAPAIEGMFGPDSRKATHDACAALLLERVDALA